MKSLMCSMIGLATLSLAATTVSAQEIDVDPAAYHESAIAGNPQWDNDYTGEQFCWHARIPSGTFLQGYRATGDEAWLEEAERYFDTLIDRMDEGPDGYKGWIGPYIYDGEVWGDVHVGDAIMFDPMLQFSEIVLVHEPELAERFGDAAERYVELARVHLFEKWDSRGTWHEDGPFGGYFQWDHYARGDDLSEWVHMPERHGAGLGLPFNKNMDMASVALRIHHITGETHYRDRAEKIFGQFKSRMQRSGDHYAWNYWEPAGAFDFDEDSDSGVRHWMQTHPHRNYQSGEVGKIVMAYHHGIVFTEADIRAILNTNLEVMWDGDEANPSFANSNYHVDPGQSREREDQGHGLAGTLWTSLSDFSQTVRDLQEARSSEPTHDRGRVSQAHTERVSHDRPVSFERRYADDDVTIPEVYAQFPLGDVDAVRMATVLPMQFAAGEGTVILGKLNRDVELEVALYDAAGDEKLGTLFEGDVTGGTDGHAGVHRIDFNGTHPETGAALAPGAYRVRWTVPGDGHREYPIEIH